MEAGLMQISEEGLGLIKEFEGFRARAYRDAVGVWTIGFGHTSMAGAPAVTPDLVITREEGTDILRRDVEMFASGVRESVKVPLSAQQFSALVSFAYNVGLGAFRSSSVLKAVNARDFAAVPRRLNLWVKAGGRILPGLVRRRAAEGALFLSAEAKPAEVVLRPAEEAKAKPVSRSRTIWGALAAALLAILQSVLVASGKAIAVLVVLAIVALAGIIIFERVKKMKLEGL
jgi:GH24 family phage-related lysozyme (muramidase)